MSYELRYKETLGDNLRRICAKQIELAIAIATGDKEPDDTPVHESRKHFEKARAAIDAWAVDQFTCKQLCCTVQNTYKCARRALAEAKSDPSSKNFHEFRTQTKLLAHQLRILRPTSPVVLKNLSDELGSLG